MCIRDRINNAASGTNGDGDQTHKFTFFQPKRSGNAAGSNEKQREATRNDLQAISSDLAWISSDLHRLTTQQAGPTATVIRRINLHYLGLNAARSSGNAAGSNEKQREATGNDLESISSDLQRSAGINSTTS